VEIDRGQNQFRAKSIQKMPAVEEAGRHGKPVPVDLETEKSSLHQSSKKPVVEAEKVEPSPVVEEASSR
jgi:hypothetical protein